VFVLQPAVGEHLSLLNYGGNILFGKEASLFLQVYSSNLSPEPFRIEYTITTQTFLYQDPTVAFADTIEALMPLSNSGPNLSSESSSPTYTLTVGDKTGTAALLIPLKSEKLPLRPFRLDVKLKQGSSETTLQHPFRVVWPEMPMSLRDIDFALEALRYITREEELDSLKSGPRDTRLKHLEEFWKSKDRTPDTEYNEMLVEYYRRVDHTMRAFSSMRGGDGYKTDRGRIYILYGTPTKTDRSLDPAAGYQEVWVYEKQSKKFVFLDQSKSGNYTLVATQNL
jgi:GWxTD domain-containing protein